MNLYMLDAVETLCGAQSGAREIVILVGKVVSMFQIAIPIILVVVGLVALGKAVVSGKDDEVKKATGGLVKKIIFAAAIFFVVAIVKLVLSLLPASDMSACWDLITNPWGENNNNEEKQED